MIEERNQNLKKMEIIIYVMGCQKSGKSLLIQAVLNKIFPNHNQDSQEILEYIELGAEIEVLEPLQNTNPIYFQDSDFLHNLKLQGNAQFKIAEYPGFILTDDDYNIRILQNFKCQTQKKNQISLLLWVINSNNAAKEEQLRITLLSSLNYEQLTKYSIQNFQPINSINTVFEEGIKDIVVYTQCDLKQLTLERISDQQKYYVSALAYLKQRKQFNSEEKKLLSKYNYQEQKLNFYYKQQLQILKNELIDAIEYQQDLMFYGSNYLRIYSKNVMLDQLVEGYQITVSEETVQQIIHIYDKITKKKIQFELEVQYLITEYKKRLNGQLQLSYRCLEELKDTNQIITYFYEDVFQDFSEKYQDIQKSYKQIIEDAKIDLYSIFGGIGSHGSALFMFERHYVPLTDQFACQLEQQPQILLKEDNFLKIIQYIKEQITKSLFEQNDVQLIYSFPDMNLSIQCIVEKLNQMAYKIKTKDRNQDIIKNLLQQNQKMLETLFVRVCQRFIVSMNYFHNFYKIFFSEFDIYF